MIRGRIEGTVAFVSAFLLIGVANAFVPVQQNLFGTTNLIQISQKHGEINSKIAGSRMTRRNSLSMSQKEEYFYGAPFAGHKNLVEERDACGVGFIANAELECNHKVVDQALRALGCMEHRGACSADKISGDGSGIMTAIPHELLAEYTQGIAPERLGVGMVFLSKERSKAAAAISDIEEALSKYSGLKLLGWREVPVNEAALGEKAAEFAPWIVQFFVTMEDDVDLPQDEFERLLYLVRRTAVYTINRDERILDKIRTSRDESGQFEFGNEEEFPGKETIGLAAMQADTYICSLSTRRIVYKGMVRGEDLSRFYLDLQDERYKTPFALYHRRFSTNTMPKWPLAQPMRVLGHNGEINTVLGNINWMRSREACQRYGCSVEELYKQAGGRLESKLGLENFLTECGSQDFEGLEQLVDPNNSDSANLDAAFELLIRSGKNAYEALMILVPEAYKNQPELRENPEVADFYRYHEHLQEPWDGPALLVFCDGKRVGACLDRNGLRPARYYITKDGMVCMHSETGVVPMDEANILEKGRLGPGQMIAVDLLEGNFLDNWTIKKQVASRFPYGEWLKNQRVVVEPASFGAERSLTDEQLLKTQTAFGWGIEDVDVQIQDMALTGKEATYSMGDDIPLAFLSEKPHVLYDYFKQRFAQVTNPPIDPLREGMVMSVEMNLGPRGNVRRPSEGAARALTVTSPVLNQDEMDKIYNSDFKSVTLSTLYDLSAGPEGLAKAVDAMTRKAIEAVQNGAEIIVLSDKQEGGVSSDQLYIPPLLATGAVHHRLIDMGLRMRASIVVESAQIWGTHHFACLVGYGASAAHPYLALETTKSWLENPKVQMQMSKGNIAQVDAEKAQENYRSSINAGLLKIMSKMGISCLNSYQGAQIFEAIGIGGDLLKLGFKGTPSRVGGLSLPELAQETATFHQQAFQEDLKKLYNYGYVKFFRGGEYHHNSVHKELHAAIRQDKFDLYNLYMDQIENRPVTSLRDMLEFNLEGRDPIPLDQVQPAEEIMKRFCTGGMSLGALSREAHETLAIALNRVGGKSNSGEGGEDPQRFQPIMDVTPEGQSESFPHLKGLKKGDIASSKIKQVASGRFGVTPEYIMSAEQMEIKIAQGAKPGEGGQLPGAKIDEYIAGLRASTPGVTLISPPPHHDIYSIEDLAQLIHDLHQINPNAGVSVKLVSEIGIGTVAAGVAKADADIIQISGHDGGTGASPLSSIKHAGSPWELGLTEVHRTLMQNGLRDRVLLRVDGGLKSGWDVMMAALLGAEEYGFGTIAMVAEGCIMARVCHTNSCPVGITTQKEELRKRFPGTPEHVVTFFQFVAEETRHILAKLGYRNIEDVIGRAALLKQTTKKQLAKTNKIDLRVLTDLPDVSDRSFLKHGPVKSVGPVLDDELVKNPEILAAIAGNSDCIVDFDIVNTDRSVGGRLAGVIAQKYGNSGFKGQLDLKFKGSAGQSFGIFGVPGMNLHLTGEANDYVGKGIHGGEIVIVPPEEADFDPSEQVIIGNTCLYGATGGKLFALGKAGERLAVRNSGATVVVEGAGDHCLEYMTGGVVVVLGKTGRNVGAGMTGGLSYILDEEGDDEVFGTYINTDTIKYQRIQTEAGEAQLKEIIEEYAQKTGSSKAQHILKNWEEFKGKFWQLYPPSQADKPVVVSQEIAMNRNATATV
mmetsp:Transcript_38995/g.49767  ORF Transcript_38995/g.49767 Transcript_38995/m.49767 type:complete len:1662 (+) Transcript_38995:108-5093(+)